MTEASLLPTILAALVAVFAHASFQLGVSVLTLLSSHSIGLRRSNNRVLSLGLSYTVGVIAATIVTVSTVSYALITFATSPSYLRWAVVAGLDAGVGIAVMLFYYRRGKGTMLWLPRQAAEFLTTRAKKTKNTFESFGLGLLTVVAELPFLIAPIATVSLLVADDPMIGNAFGWTLLYSLVVSLPILAVLGMIGSGHRISTIQRWREANKTFLQFTSGGALIVLGCFVLARFGLGVDI